MRADNVLHTVALHLVASMARNLMHRALPRRSGVKPRLTRAMAKVRAQTCRERKPAHCQSYDGDGQYQPIDA